jgi:hypothetical protein
MPWPLLLGIGTAASGGWAAMSTAGRLTFVAAAAEPSIGHLLGDDPWDIALFGLPSLCRLARDAFRALQDRAAELRQKDFTRVFSYLARGGLLGAPVNIDRFWTGWVKDLQADGTPLQFPAVTFTTSGSASPGHGKPIYVAMLVDRRILVARVENGTRQYLDPAELPADLRSLLSQLGGQIGAHLGRW